mgnify:CR=1 FL=1
MWIANLPLRAGQSVALRVEWTPRVTFRQAAVDDYGTTLGPALRLGWAPLHEVRLANGRRADILALQPGGGSHAVYTNACVMRRYFEARGELGQRNLIRIVNESEFLFFFYECLRQFGKNLVSAEL